MTLKHDVVIVGGGIAGALAAVAAARKGVSTIVIEETGQLGGCLTSSGTGPMMTFHAGEKQVIRGLGEELVSRLKEKGLSPGHTVDSTGYTYTVTPFDAEGMKRELELMILEAGGHILYHAVLSDAEIQGDLKRITVLCCSQKIAVEGKVFIDATGDAALCMMSGVGVDVGRSKDGKNQPMTMNFRLSGVDIALIRRMMEEDVSLFPFLVPHEKGFEKKAVRLSCSGFQDIMKNGIRSGELDIDRDIVLFFEDNTPGEVIVNMTRISGLSPVDPLEFSAAETEGRRQVWLMYSYLKKNIPGFSESVLLSSGPRIGVRSSRRMKGVYSITARDMIAETLFDDGIACCGYPIDIHSADGAATDSTFLRYGGYYSIPYRCLINEKVSNIMAAGRDVSSEFEANASLRVSPCCTALGQAAGTAAALAILKGVSPLDIDVSELRKILRGDGAIVE